MEQVQCADEHEFLADCPSPQATKLSKRIESREVFYAYSQAREIINIFLYPPFARADCSANDRGLIYFLYGGYHTGKSHLVRFFISFMQWTVHPEMWELFELPIVKIDLSNHINTAKQLLMFLLEKLGRPVDARVIRQWKKTNSDYEMLKNRLIKLLERLGTRMLILDESQKLLLSHNPDIMDIFELLKDLTTKHNWSGDLRTQIVLCGTQESIPLLEAADWIQGRTRTVKLNPVKPENYAQLLMKIYRDYISIGLSDKWDLVNTDPETKNRTLNRDLAQYFFTRTDGKVGLTVDLIRNSVLNALDQGRLYPTQTNYEDTRLTEKSYLISDNFSLSNSQAKKQDQINVKEIYHLRSCSIRGCPKSRKTYKDMSALVNHYKRKHPEIELVYSDKL